MHNLQWSCEKPTIRKHQKVQIDNESSLIFGKDKTERIVNITVQDGVAFIYKEHTNGSIEVETRPHKYWALAPKTITGWAQHAMKLDSNNYYKVGYRFEDYDTYVQFRRQNYKQDVWGPGNHSEQIMIHDGLTYFKNMQINEVSVLSFDIETLSLKPNSPDAGVVIIANTYRHGSGALIQKLFDIKDFQMNESDMLDAWVAWVQKVNPSLMVGHNIFSFDIPYLNTRYQEYHSTNLPLGRDGSPLIVDERLSSFRKDGSQSYDYHNIFIHGREIIDSFFLSVKYDIGRKFNSYGLKQIMKDLGKEKQGRIIWDFAKYKVRDILHNPTEWQLFREYANDDSADALVLFDLMAPSYFYLNRSIPFTFQQMINRATGSMINSYMIRSYLQFGHSIPKADEVVPFQGAISFGIPGRYRNVFSVDFSGLYPSIIRQYKIYDKQKDIHRNFLKTVEYFTLLRFKNKKLSKETGKQYYKDLEQSQKIFVNSCYGFLSAPGLHFNSPNNGALITKYGREILDYICQIATGKSIHWWKDQILENTDE